MIHNPKYGWCQFRLDNFYATPSYLTDVPVDLLNAFINYHVNGSGSAYFDEEGSTFTLVLTPDSVYIIAERERPILYSLPEIKINELEKELVSDIEYCLDDWAAEFITCENINEIKKHRNEITALIDKLNQIQLVNELIEFKDIEETEIE